MQRLKKKRMKKGKSEENEETAIKKRQTEKIYS